MEIPNTVAAFEEWFVKYYPLTYRYLTNKFQSEYNLKLEHLEIYLIDGQVSFNELIPIAEKEKERRAFAKSFNNLLNE